MKYFTRIFALCCALIGVDSQTQGASVALTYNVAIAATPSSAIIGANNSYNSTFTSPSPTDTNPAFVSGTSSLVTVSLTDTTFTKVATSGLFSDPIPSSFSLNFTAWSPSLQLVYTGSFDTNTDQVSVQQVNSAAGSGPDKLVFTGWNGSTGSNERSFQVTLINSAGNAFGGLFTGANGTALNNGGTNNSWSWTPTVWDSVTIDIRRMDFTNSAAAGTFSAAGAAVPEPAAYALLGLVCTLTGGATMGRRVIRRLSAA